MRSVASSTPVNERLTTAASYTHVPPAVLSHRLTASASSSQLRAPSRSSQALRPLVKRPTHALSALRSCGPSVVAPQKSFLSKVQAVSRTSECGLSSNSAARGARVMAAAASAVVPAVTPSQELEVETDTKGRSRVKFQREGWNFWEWQGHKIHFLEAGPKDAPKVLLVHGYGASAYHWRYNVPALAERYHVFALDLLGFGWSTKALVDYSGARVWTKEISDFICEVVGGGPVVLMGNSLGGYAALSTAAQYPDLVSGLVLLNAAGPFDDPSQPPVSENAPEPWWKPVQESVVSAVKRVVLYFAFLRARQPERIKQVLTFVYSSTETIDEDLVDSIVQPALDPLASEVFFLVNQQRGPRVTVNKLLSQLKAPLLLLWGDLDPWITPERAQRMKSLYPSATLVGLQSGHCPHDDSPEECNAALLEWLDAQQLPAEKLP